jgi:hypothetical protein
MLNEKAWLRRYSFALLSEDRGDVSGEEAEDDDDIRAARRTLAGPAGASVPVQSSMPALASPTSPPAKPRSIGESGFAPHSRGLPPAAPANTPADDVVVMIDSNSSDDEAQLSRSGAKAALGGSRGGYDSISPAPVSKRASRPLTIASYSSSEVDGLLDRTNCAISQLLLNRALSSQWRLRYSPIRLLSNVCSADPTQTR